MQMDLTNVIEKIKQEGVEEAEKKSTQIINDAEEKSKQILAAAQKKKDEMIAQAKEESNKLEENSKSAINQAARDVIIALKTQIITLLDLVIKKEVSDSLTSDVLKDIIIKI